MTNTRFKKGSKVEVLSKTEVSIGSWHCAEIVSGNGHTYSVRYDLLPQTPDAVEDRVPRKIIRPCPPPVEGAEDWVPGAHLEVFHNLSWRTVTIVKVFGGQNLFVVRLLGASEEFTVHRSRIRVRQSWQDGKWFVIGKGYAFSTMSTRTNRSPTRILKRGYPVGLIDLETYAFTCQKRRAIEEDRSPQQIFSQHPPLFHEKVDAYICPQQTLCGQYMHTFFDIRTSRFSETDVGRGKKPNKINDCSRQSKSTTVDSDSCVSTISSCSVSDNVLCQSPFNSKKNHIEDSECHISDAESFCELGYEKEGISLSKNEELVAGNHSLKLNIYRNTLKALYASGPLRWEDEAKVTDLRHVLHISDDEHLVEIRNLMASDSRISVS